MKRIFFSLEGHNLVVIEFISAEYFVVQLLRFFFMITAHIFTELCPW